MFSVKSSIIKKYFFSVMVLSLIPVVILSTFFYMERSIEIDAETEKARLNSIEQVKNRIDFLESDFENISLELAYTLSLQQQPQSASYIEMLSHYKSMFEIPPEIVLFNKKTNTIFTAENEMSYHEWENSHGNSYAYNLSLSSFYTRLISDNMSQIFSPTPRDGLSGLDEKGICFMYPLTDTNNIPTDNIAFLYDSQSIENIIRSYMGDINGYFIIYDPYLFPCYTGKIGEPENIELTENVLNLVKQTFGTGVNSINDNGSELMSIRTISEISGLTYSIIMSSEDYYASQAAFNYEFISMILLILLVFALLSVIFAVYNYSPFRKLMKQVDTDDEHDELLILNKIVNDNTILSSRLKQVSPIIRNRCIEHILISNKDIEKLRYYVKCAGIEFDLPLFVSMIVIINNDQTNIEECTVLIDTITSKNAKLFTLELAPDKDRFAILCNHDLDDEQFTQLAHSIKNTIENHFHAKTFIGIGSVCNALDGCCMSFLKAKTAIDLRKNDEEIVVFSPPPEQSDKYPTVNMSLLLQSIKLGNKSGAMAVFNDICSDMKSNRNSAIVFKYLTAEIVSSLIRFAQNNGYSIDAGTFLSTFTEQSYVEDFKRETEKLIINITDHISNEHDVQSNEVKMTVIREISEHYKEYDICVESIAKQLNLSPRYVGRLVMEETGYKFSGYITYLRMEYAKKLLSETNLRVKDIVSEIGYVDDSSFIRKFKYYENMTPKEYRTMMRGE